jgi:prophage regulatory protein
MPEYSAAWYNVSTSQKNITASVDERLLSTRELLERLPLNRATVWRMVREGRFPAPVQIAASRIGWRWSAVLNWITEREQHPLEPRVYFGRDKKTSAEAGSR